MGFVIFLVGFSTPYWLLHTDFALGAHLGLWEYCSDRCLSLEVREGECSFASQTSHNICVYSCVRACETERERQTFLCLLVCIYYLNVSPSL